MVSLSASAGDALVSAARMLESEMKRNPVPCGIDKRKKPKWEYTDGLELQAALAVAKRCPELREKTLAWAQDYIDRMVTKDGEILGYRMEDCKLDCINPGKFAFDMYELAGNGEWGMGNGEWGMGNGEWATGNGERGIGNGEEVARLRKVLDTQFAQFAIQPRVAEGGFWHKKVYTHQMWLDGLYMGCPFYARYASRFLEGDARRAAFDDIANQFAVVTRHTYDAKTGLYRHGWDESKSMIWADKTTGQSAHAWGRALGWFAAAIVDTEEYFPADHPGREQLRKLMREYTATLIRWQDSSGAWWQVADQPGREGNYLESTATALIGYAMMKGVNRGILGEDAKAAALKAWNALKRDFLKRETGNGEREMVSLTRCCSVAGLSADRDGSFEYYLREKIVDNDPKGVGPYMFLALEIEDAQKRAFDIQREIDRVAASGGGRVVVPAGEWTSGAIHLKSNVELHLSEGAKIVFTENLDDYLPAVRTSWEGIECMGYSPLVYAFGCTNVAVTGKGTLAPFVETRWRAWGLARKKNPAHDAAKKRLAEWARDNAPMEERQYWKLEESLMRPPLIQFNRCKGVRLEGVTIRQSPFWTIHLLCSEDVVVRGLDVYCDLKNSDGIDIESSKNVLVENCTFEQGDDAVVIKSGINHEGRRRAMPSEDIVVRNCVINDGHSMLSIGSELSGGIRNVLMEDCRAEKTVDKIFFIKTNPERGGFVENVTMRRIKALDVKYEAVSAITDYFWKPGSIPLDGVLRATPVKNIVLEDISATSAKAVYSFRGYETEPIRGLTLKNVKVGKVTKPSSAEFVEDMSVVDTPSSR